MMLWAFVASAVVGFVLGTQCRVLLLAGTSALIAGAAFIGLPLDGPEPDGRSTVFALASLVDSGPTFTAIIALIITHQAFFLGGAVWRVVGPVFSLSAEPHNSLQGTGASQSAHLRAATDCGAGRDARID